MSFRLVSISVTLTDRERRSGRYFALFQRTHVRRRPKTITPFQNLLLIVYDYIKTICAIIQRLFGQNKLITRCDGRRCIDD